MLDEYLKENNSSRYQIFKAVGTPQSTLSFYTKKPLKEYPVSILVAIGRTIDNSFYSAVKAGTVSYFKSISDNPFD